MYGRAPLSGHSGSGVVAANDFGRNRLGRNRLGRSGLGRTLERIELARSCNASEWHLLSKIILPSCLPFLFAGLGVASVLAILGAVVGEFVGASAGLGMLLMQYDQQMQLGPLFAVILLLALIGFLMNSAIGLLERRYCFWAQRANASARP